MKELWLIENIGDFAEALARELGDREIPYLWAKREDLNTEGSGFSFKTSNFKRTSRPLGVSNFYGSLELNSLLKLVGEGDAHIKDLNQFDYANTSSLYGVENMLNNKYVLLPFRDFKDNLYYVASLFAEEAKVFIRPNSSEKLFTGRLFDLLEFNKPIEDFKYLKDNDIIVISSPKQIIGEWRFICKNDNIIDKSLYRFNNLTTEVNSAPLDMVDFVKNAIDEKPASGLYTLDIAMVASNDFKIIEANGCFTAGLYACDPKKLLDAI